MVSQRADKQTPKPFGFKGPLPETACAGCNRLRTRLRAHWHYLNHPNIPWERSIALVTHTHYGTQRLMHNAVRSTLIFMI